MATSGGTRASITRITGRIRKFSPRRSTVSTRMRRIMLLGCQKAMVVLSGLLGHLLVLLGGDDQNVAEEVKLFEFGLITKSRCTYCSYLRTNSFAK